MGTKILSIFLYGVGILAFFFNNMFLSPVSRIYFLQETPSVMITLMGAVLLIALGFLSVLALQELIKIIVTHQKMKVEWYPIIISAYVVLLLTQNLITQYNLSFTSAVISIIYVVTALAWIVFGFMRRYSFIRRFGLGLAIMSVLKLFLLDLAGLAQGYRIISYFTLGVTLLAISFVYQYFSKRMERKACIKSS